MTLWTGLEGTFLFAALMIAFAIQTAVLAAGIWLLSGENDNPFHEEGQIVAWGKCAGLVAGVLALSFIPNGAVLALVGWFLGIMILFHFNFGQAFMIFLANLAIGAGVNWLLMQAFK